MLGHSNVFSSDKDELDRFRNKSSMGYGLFANLKYQKAIGNRISLGLNGKYYSYEHQTGLKFDLFSRFYPVGVFQYFYVQGKIASGKHSILMNYTSDGTATGNGYNNKRVTYEKFIWGCGADLGLHIPISKSRQLFIDFNFGYNYYPFPKDIPLVIEQNGGTYYASDVILKRGFLFINNDFIGDRKWYEPVIGAGTKIDLTFTLGWVL